MPKRINKSIELLEEGQPIYYVGVSDVSYEIGLEMAGTWADYLAKADVWPMNPEGELMLGVKIENKRALANSETTAKVPGLSFGEWGPGDMGMSLGFPGAHDAPYPAKMLAAQARVMAACLSAGLFFLNGVNTENVVERKLRRWVGSILGDRWQFRIPFLLNPLTLQPNLL